MKKIAIDEATSKLLDELTETSSRRRSRAALVRMALRQYAKTQRQRETDAKDDEVFRKHRKRLARQARVLITEQSRS
jgi:metal-responsive CopG/Arc/MetJ family transcriptional regulator